MPRQQSWAPAVDTTVRVPVVVGKSLGQWESSAPGIAGVTGRNKTEVLAETAERISAALESTEQPVLLVQHEDGTLSYVQAVRGVVSLTRIRDGRTVGSEVADRWQTPQDAADDAVKPSHYGPGHVVRIA